MSTPHHFIDALSTARATRAKAGFAVMAILILAGPVVADAEWSEQGRCAVPDSFIAQNERLTRTARKLRTDMPIKIIAIGSSSTEGVGASMPDNAYPARLAEELERLWPQADVTVINRGIGGERNGQMLARFDKDIFAANPDLVIWQTGTNGALDNDKAESLREEVVYGVKRLQAAGIDVVLMSPQYAPSFNRQRRNLLHVEAIRSAGRETGVAIFRRFEIMQYWLSSGQMTLDEMLSPDGLHLNDLSYGCVANQMASLIDHATRQRPLLLTNIVTGSTLPASVFAGEGTGE